MKKLLLFSAILIGAASASQAGVSFNFRIGLPLPRPNFVIGRPGPAFAPAPVWDTPSVVSASAACESANIASAPRVCEPAPVITTPTCEPSVIVQPRVVIAPWPVPVERSPAYGLHRYAYNYRQSYERDHRWDRSDRDHGRSWDRDHSGRY